MLVFAATCFSNAFEPALYSCSDDCATLFSVIHQVLTGKCTNHHTNANCRAIARSSVTFYMALWITLVGIGGTTWKKKQTPARKADNNETCVQRRRDMKPLSPRITDSLIFALSRRSIEWNIFNHSPRESVEKYLCINCERTNCIVWVGRERQLIRVMYVIVLLHVYVLLRSEWAIWVVKLKYVLSFTYCVVTYGVSDFQQRISLNSKNGTIEIT